MRKKLLNKSVFFLVALVFIFSLCFKAGYSAKANQDKPDVEITVTTNKSTMLVNEELEVKYRIEPQPINIDDINKKTNKEIILVVDTSGSMNDRIDRRKTRIQALKEAAENFIDKFKDEDKVKIGIVSYATKAEQSIELISSKDQSRLVNIIDNLKAEGATNIGDGIRVAAEMFSKDTSVKKYLVLMSDGMPTALTYIGEGGYYKNKNKYIIEESIARNPNIYWWNNSIKENEKWKYCGINDTSNLKYGAYGDYDPNGYCLKYSTLMAAELKDKNITNYVIGFSGGSDSTKLTQIAQSGGGTYYDARDAKSINEVYSNIGDQIKADYAVEDVKLNFNLPEGLECSVNNSEISNQDKVYIKSIPNIKYYLNKDKTQYVADPFEIVVRLKANKSGNYTLGSDWQLSYKGVNNNNVIKAVPTVNVVVNKYNIDFDVSRRLLPETNNGQFNINKEFEMEYIITPKPISAQISQRPKEIMLVVDTSRSMEWAVDKDDVKGNPSRLDLTKTALNNFIEKFKNYKDVKIGLVTYSSKGEIYSNNENYFFSPSDMDSLKNKIGTLTANGGTNLGDGIRRATWALSSNKDAKKYIVLMTDGEPTFFSYKYNDDYGKYVYYTELDNKDVVTNSYNDEERGLVYSKLMASALRENKDLDIKTFAIGFSKGANVDKLKEIADSAGGTYLDATANDEEAINNVYMGIADKIKADFTLDNVKLNEALPEGFTIADSGTNNFTKDFKVNYVYNSDKKQYEAEPISIKVKVMPSKIGNYQLKNDAVLSYTDLEGISHSNKFNPLNIAIVDDYVVKQGLFQRDDSYKGNYPGENNIKYFDSLDIVNDSLTRLGAFIRTSGQETNIGIKINEAQNPLIKSISDLKVNVFKVNEKGELVKTNIDARINSKNNNSSIISIKLPQENTNGYSYYIVNYDFKANTEGKDNVSMTSKCEIQGTNRSSDLNVRIADLPDLF